MTESTTAVGYDPDIVNQSAAEVLRLAKSKWGAGWKLLSPVQREAFVAREVMYALLVERDTDSVLVLKVVTRAALALLEKENP